MVSCGHHAITHFVFLSGRELPSSFKASYGKIVYKLEARLSRSMRVDSKAKAHVTLVNNGKSDLSLMVPTLQYTHVYCTSALYTSL